MVENLLNLRYNYYNSNLLIWAYSRGISISILLDLDIILIITGGCSRRGGVR
jgi:hypothetical protein